MSISTQIEQISLGLQFQIDIRLIGALLISIDVTPELAKDTLAIVRHA
jgi:hypothetical protein